MCLHNAPGALQGLDQFADFDALNFLPGPIRHEHRRVLGNAKSRGHEVLPRVRVLAVTKLEGEAAREAPCRRLLIPLRIGVDGTEYAMRQADGLRELLGRAAQM